MPAALLAGAAVVAVVVLVLALVGVSSQTPDGSRQRSTLGPLAHRFWEAERTGDFGTVWDLAEGDFQRRWDRATYVAHAEACPRTLPPRDVTRMGKAGARLWEVESVDPSGAPGLSYFRQEGDYDFGAVLDDADLERFLAAPVETAPEQRWCRRP